MGPFRFSDRTLAVAIGLFAAGYLVLAFDLPDFTAVQVPVQPATLPRWLGAVLLLLAVLLFFQRRDPEAGVGADSAPTATTASPGPTPAWAGSATPGWNSPCSPRPSPSTSRCSNRWGSSSRPPCTSPGPPPISATAATG